VSVPVPTRGTVDSFDHVGLFMVPLNRPQAMCAVTRAVAPPAMRPGRGRVGPTETHKGGLRRHCSGCAGETEHVRSATDWRGSIPPIRWTVAEPASGTTFCLDCGQRRPANFRPSPPEWSEWPRTRIATPSLAADTADSPDTSDDWVSETAAENEGMPPKGEPRLHRRSTRLRNVRASSASVQMKGS
jgi:hypothetical protein